MAKLQLPGQISLKVQQQSGPNAHPYVTTINLQDAISLQAIGGLSKVELATIHMACALAPASVRVNESGQIETIDGFGGVAASMAIEALIAAQHAEQQMREMAGKQTPGIQG